MRIIVRTNDAHKKFIMSHVFDSSAVKKPTNLTVNSDLLSRARKLNINLSATLEKALVAELKNAEKQSWLKKNKKAISALNNFSEKNGLFSDSYREL
jgi:antitoxin CcdA